MDHRDRINHPSPEHFSPEDIENVPVNDSANTTFGDIVNARFDRRNMMRGMLGTVAIGALLGPAALAGRAEAAIPKFLFPEIEAGIDETHHVPEGYEAQVLIRWGDPIIPGGPAFDPNTQTAEKQKMQLGYNNDFLGFVPLPFGSGNANHGLLCVNHEYTNRELMFPNTAGRTSLQGITPEKAAIEMAAHGGSIIEIKLGQGGQWQVVPDSKYNRRITMSSTEMQITGPAAGHPRLRTKADPTGTRVIGMLNNCAGGITPWGTWLSGEENINFYFTGELAADSPEAANHRRFGLPNKFFAWNSVDERFDVGKDPNEPNRFGWIVEIDPLDPNSTPRKRTALGRVKHEGCNIIINKDGRAVAFTGDDQQFEYVYRFVSKGKFNPKDRKANMRLLDEGTLSVARFNADGTMDWLPLVHGQGPLTAANGFRDQGDVLIEARRAADLLGATKMDRPEDVEPNPKTGKTYVMLTNNESRKPEQKDAANPRGPNVWGHIVELTPPNGDQAASRFKWEILLQAGDPSVAAVGAQYHPATSKNGWMACPDNCAFDSKGRMWVATDQGDKWNRISGRSDGLYAVETEGELRGMSTLFFRAPVGAEVCGPWFAPDDRTLFVAVQHPSADGTDVYKPFMKPSTFNDPATRWPDFKPGMPPRPSILAIRRKDGGKIGA